MTLITTAMAAMPKITVMGMRGRSGDECPTWLSDF
jgi:hypothetical protein